MLQVPDELYHARIIKDNTDLLVIMSIRVGFELRSCRCRIYGVKLLINVSDTYMFKAWTVIMLDYYIVNNNNNFLNVLPISNEFLSSIRVMAALKLF